MCSTFESGVDLRQCDRYRIARLEVLVSAEWLERVSRPNPAKAFSDCFGVFLGFANLVGYPGSA
jgi:hypothetical protein